MSILQLYRVAIGQVGVAPGEVKMLSTDDLATITTADYLNDIGTQLKEIGLSPLDVIECMYNYDTVLGTASYAVLTVSISDGVITLVDWANPGDVLLPVVSGDFAVFNGTSGQIKDAGYSASDPAKTKVAMVGSAVVLNRIAHFIDTAGTIDDTAAAVTNAGDIYAGLSGTAGALRSYPSAATSGYLGLAGVANSGDFGVLISNAAHGQATTYVITDAANANGRLLNAAGATPFVNGNFPKASGTGGLMVDSGIAVSALQLSANIKAAQSADIGGAGAGPIDVAVAGLTASSVVVASVLSSSNTVAVAKVLPGTDKFSITFDGDPGAACVINYVAFVAAQ